MRRATTPTHRFVFDEDPRGFERVLITYAQGGNVVLEKELGDLTDVSQSGGKYIAQYRLTQSEANRFSTSSKVDVQVRVLRSDGAALASGIKHLGVEDVLDDRVLS